MLFEVGRITMRNFQNIVILVFLALGEMDDFQCRSPSYLLSKPRDPVSWQTDSIAQNADFIVLE